MLKLSKKSDYALIVLSHLCSAANPVSAHEVSGIYHLPHPMVANILKQLSGAGFIESRRGQHGGYILAKLPSAITLADIVRSMDSQFNFVECAVQDNDCKVEGCCPTRDPLLALHNRIEEFLESLTLEEIVNHPNFGNPIRSEKNEVAHLS